jgi:hypothetical protein
MQRFLYYIPRITSATEGRLVEFGLRDRFVGMPGQRIEPTGPDARGGLILSSGGEPANCPPWEQWTDFGKWWLAVEHPAPGPDDLQRPLQIGGYKITLADDNEWKVPTILKWDTSGPFELHHFRSNLSLVHRFKDGKVRYCVRKEYEPLAEIGDRVLKMFKEQKWDGFDSDDAWALLSANYLVGREEILTLGLCDNHHLALILQAAIDLPTWIADGEAAASNGLEAMVRG